MADEARAMLDALMGQDRNADLPVAGNGNQDWDSLRKKKSCYDNDVCPLYCAWGVDVYELFTNTKSDIGPNNYLIRDDARAEYLSLPEHEKERLGFDRMLHRKLGDLVRSCDRIVSRNKEKLRQEIAAAAKARGGASGKAIDPVTDVSDEMMAEAAEMMAELELREEEVKLKLQNITKIDAEFKDLWGQLQELEKKKASSEDEVTNASTNEDSEVKKNDEVDVSTETPKDPTDVSEKKEENAESSEVNSEAASSTEEAKIKEIKSKLYALSAEQQQIIGSIANMTSQVIVPLRDNLQNITKQIYYVKTDISADKTVCEVSGNFMSSRDAEERIAAHYAGKQYVGWKMVREKFRELDQKMRTARPAGPPPGRYGGGPRGGYGQGPGYGGRGYNEGGRSRYNDRGGRNDYGYGGRDRSYSSRDSGRDGYHRRGGYDGGHRGWR
jgi:hypothetical protein